MSRAITLYASAYSTERTHELRIRQDGQRTFTVNMNGAMDDGVTVSSVTWDTSGQSVCSIASPVTADRQFSATVTGLNQGNAEIEAQATLSDGSISVQRIAVWVL